tara:strand:- start:2710 stop:3642 length:933 start_codon:yes stop_codon:yes gene_type:complete
MKKILVSGAAGFIGSHLVDKFLSKNFKVLGVDNFLTGSVDNINHNFNNPNFSFIEHDICKPLNTKDKLDYILHFASPASPNDYLRHPIKTLQIGSKGTENMLELAKINKAIILLASTSEIYGDPLTHPQPESYFGNVNPIGPRGVYDEAKRYLEAISFAYKRKHNISIRLVRIFNTYGPRMRKEDGRAIPCFINQAINNQDFTVYGDGNQTRSFCFISDTVEGIYKLLLSNYENPLNIGNPNEKSILELVNTIKKLYPSNSKITYKTLPENDPLRRKPDISLAKKKLNWEPIVNLEIGLMNTINYYLKSF